MARITDCSCFKIFYCLPTNCYNGEELIEYIDEYEPQYLNDLLGCELAAQLCQYIKNRKSDPENTEVVELFENIINPFCKSGNKSCCTDCCKKCEIKSEGLKKMLTGFIYYEYMIQKIYTAEPLGFTKQKSQKGKQADVCAAEREAERRYNKAIETYKAIQWCIENDGDNLCPCSGSNQSPLSIYKGCEKCMKFSALSI